MGTLMSQAEIGVWVQAPGAFMWGSGSITPTKMLRLCMRNPIIQCVLAENGS